MTLPNYAITNLHSAEYRLSQPAVAPAPRLLPSLPIWPRIQELAQKAWALADANQPIAARECKEEAAAIIEAYFDHGAEMNAKAMEQVAAAREHVRTTLAQIDPSCGF